MNNPTAQTNNLLTTWLTYKADVFGDTQADVLRQINSKLGTKYNQVWLHRLKIGARSVPATITGQFIEPDLAEVAKWLFESNGWPTNGINFTLLAQAFTPPTRLPEGDTRYDSHRSK